jgi:hypothetical protein
MASSSSGFISSTPKLLHNLITIKLSPDTYMFWRAQLECLLQSHLLMGYVDGTLPSPSPTLSVKKEGKDVTDDTPPDVIPNPKYFAWCQHGKAILSAILGSLTLEVVGLVMFPASSHEAWTTLSRSFSSHSQARAGQLRSQLAATKKEGALI